MTVVQKEKAVTIMAQEDLIMNYILCTLSLLCMSEFCKTHQLVVPHVLLAKVKVLII